MPRINLLDGIFMFMVPARFASAVREFMAQNSRENAIDLAFQSNWYRVILCRNRDADLAIALKLKFGDQLIEITQPWYVVVGDDNPDDPDNYDSW
jgi:hypothetical protein